MNAVEVENLTRRFGDFTAVENISFHVSTGEIFGFLGANGAGKSTTIRMLCGILPPTSGRATLLGTDLVRNPERIKKSIGYMSQKFTLYNDLTVRENINFFGGIHRIDSEEMKRRSDEILTLSELKGEENRITGSLPGGWKQRLALGCSIIHRPGILFLDEPTAGVDPAARRTFWEIIHRLRRSGTTIFVTSHYMDEVEQCDRVALMHQGKIAALDSPTRLKHDIIPGSVMEIRCSRPREAKEILDRREDILRTDPSGTGLRIMAKVRGKGHRDKFATDLESLLRKEGIEAGECIWEAPTLEDVFVYLIGSLEEQS